MVKSSQNSLLLEPESWVEPFWTYVLGEDDDEDDDDEPPPEKRSWGIKRRSKNDEPEEEESSFVSNFFTVDDRQASSSSRNHEHAAERMSSGINNQLVTSLFPRTDAADDSVNFPFFGAESLANETSLWSFLDKPFEVAEDDLKRLPTAAGTKAQKAVAKDSTKESQPSEMVGGLPDSGSWLDIFSAVAGDKATKAEIVAQPIHFKSRPSTDSRSVVSSRTFMDQPNDISPQEWKRQQAQIRKQEKKDQKAERKARRAIERQCLMEARKAEALQKRLDKELLRQQKDGGNGDGASTGILTSGSSGKPTLKKRLLRFKRKPIADTRTPTEDTEVSGSKEAPPVARGSEPAHSSAEATDTPSSTNPFDTLSIFPEISWFPGGDGSESEDAMNHSTIAASELSARVWDGITEGITASLEPWLRDADDDDEYSTSSSEISTETESASAADADSQVEGPPSVNDVSNQERIPQPFNDDKPGQERRLEPRIKPHRVRDAPAHPWRQDLLKLKPIHDLTAGPDPCLRQDASNRQLEANLDIWDERNDLTDVREKAEPFAIDTKVMPFNRRFVEKEIIPPSLTPRSTPRAGCRSIKSLSASDMQLACEIGLPIHELNQEELAAIFPRLRSVVNDESSRKQSHVIGNANSFERDLPAHVQAVLEQEGPQSLCSLYEYEYESPVHKILLFESFGDTPRDLLKLHSSVGPPHNDAISLDHDMVLVQVEASTVSLTDCAIRRGDLIGKRNIRLPNSPGVDVVGVLYRVQADTQRRYHLHKGERVMSLTKWGGNARFLAVKPEELVKVPDNVDPAEAACLTETYLSAFQVLHLGQSASMRYLSGALKGKSFLLVGNVQPNFGRAIGQLALIGGADCVYATARSKHAQKLCTFGILPVSNDPLDWCARLAGKIDVVIVLSETLSPLHYKVLAESGQVIVMAHANGDFCLETDRSESKAALLVCTRNKSLSRWQSHNYDVYLEWDRNLKRCKADLQHLVRLLQERSVLPYVLDRIPLTKVPRAHEMIELKKLPGFIVCEPWLVSKSRAVAL